ncbi:MAG: SHOCT domain-containing protein [Spirochaetia bacterium]|jgi:putative membrane protein
MWGWGYGNWLGWLGPLVMVVFWAAVITGIVFLVRYFIRQGSGRDREDSALEVLRKRYARGEISKEEYLEKRGDLM